MATVYLARDLRHDRDVAIKVLEPHMASSDAGRFLREIRIAARLTHPHVLGLHDSGEAGDTAGGRRLFYVMPYVDGETLRSRLTRDGALPLGDAVRLTRELADALAYAHGHGVVHRDLKPENVLLSGGHAVVADFGIAKALAATVQSSVSPSASFTATGVAIGTPAYMAPEQAIGDMTLDHRADLYALGVVAYEMLAGAHPFGRRTAQAVAAAHLTETPAPLAERRPDVPPALADVVMQLLAKDPSARPQHAEDVVRVLDSVSTGATAPTPRQAVRSTRRMIIVAGTVVAVIGAAIGLSRFPRRIGATNAESIRSIAVLPFENTSKDTAFDYLEDGIIDQVRDALNRIPGLTVKARGSSRQLKGQGAREVGKRLAAAAVLQGALSRSSDRLHVTSELVRADDDAVLWSATFDVAPESLPAVQDTIIRALTARLSVTDAAADVQQRSVTMRGTTNTDAYYLYLRGRHAADAFAWDKASALFRQAVAKDPRFTRALGALATSYSNEPVLGRAPVDSMNQLARVTAAMALAVDPTVAEAYVAQGNAFLSEVNFVEARRAFERAYAADSSDADVIWPYGAVLYAVGDVDGGLAVLRRGRERDPLSATFAGLMGYGFRMRRQYDSALALTRLAGELQPDNPIVSHSLGFIYAFRHVPDSAVAEFEKAFRLDSLSYGGRANLVFGYAVAGRWRDADRERAIIERSPAGNSPNYSRMVVHLAYGQYEAAMSDMERGIAAQEAQFGVPSLACDALFDPLKSRMRFQALMRRLGLRVCPVTGDWPIGTPARLH
jgi:serine/threonine-protein kinase